MQKGCLHLLPSLLDQNGDLGVAICPVVHEVLSKVDGFFVETPKVSRAYLKKFENSYYKLPMLEVNKKTRDFCAHIKMLEEGKNVGLLTDCGLACLADPGARLVDAAYEADIKVKAYVGPSSIYLALMYSGFYAQKFTFHGYLPRDITPNFIEKGVHIFIETPYRTRHALQALLENLDDADRIMVGINLMSPEESIIRGSVAYFKKRDLELHKQECIFVIEKIAKEKRNFFIKKKHFLPKNKSLKKW